jgi:hypothetical protein
MRAKILTLAIVLAVATPVFAKTAPAAPEPDHTGPIPYADLAAMDAKMNMPAKHMMKKHMVKKAAASTTTTTTTETKTTAK